MLIILVSCWSASCQTVSPWQKEIDAARQEIEKEVKARTAKAKLTLRVVDAQGGIVTNANAMINVTYFEKEDNAVTGKTDRFGVFSAERMGTDGSCVYSVSKEGFYDTRGRYFFKDGILEQSLLDKRWMPWNPTVDVVIKEKRQPIPMTVILDKTVRFPQGTNIWYDCEAGDLLPPFGKGKHPDFGFTYSSKINPNAKTLADWGFFTNQLVVVTDKDGGFIECKKDRFSTFFSAYNAPEAGYKNSLVYEVERGGGKMTKNKRLNAQTDYLIFKTRIVRDKDGNIVSANYGKIYVFNFGEGAEPPGTQGRVGLQSYFNPTPNDTNLEADPSKNLSEYFQEWRGNNKGFEP